MMPYNENLVADILEASPVIKALRDALKPLADLDIAHCEDWPDRHPLWGANATLLTVGDVRRARAALNA